MMVLGLFHIRQIYLFAGFLTIIPLLIYLSSTKNFQVTQVKPSPVSTNTRTLLLHSPEGTTNNSIDSNGSDQIKSNVSTSNTTTTANHEVDGSIKTSYLFEPGFIDARPSLCRNDSQLLIMITSAPPNSEARKVIRETWGGHAKSLNVSLAFVLGSTTNETIDAMLQTEEQEYGDVIRGKSFDSYVNLTLKTISIMEWVKDYCSNVSFVLKTDDDVFINVPKLLQLASELSSEKRAIYGRLATKWKPFRDKKSKYFVSLQQFPHKFFPPFTTGPAYLFPAHIAKDIFYSALLYNFFKLEDVFITGMVADGLKIERVSVKTMLNGKVIFSVCNLKKNISLHSIRGAKQRDLWTMLNKPTPKHCKI